MRHHKARYPLAKERDYVFCESRAFFGDLKSFLMFFEKLQELREAPYGFQQILIGLKEAVEKHDLRPLRDLCEKARQLAWNTMRTPHEDTGALFLSFLHWLTYFDYAWSKTPTEYDRQIRPKDLPGEPKCPKNPPRKSRTASRVRPVKRAVTKRG